MSISVKNVTKFYGEQKALDSISFEIGAGEIVGFLGPNGAGKSTMMKIITCYIPQNEGDVKVCGYDVLDESLNVRKNVGYLPEHNPLYLDMYVKEYLQFIAGLHKLKKPRERAMEMIEIVGLSLEHKKKIGALSKGYRQRVGLAQAMIHNPQVLILDEPTSGLDPNQLVEIRSLIKNIGKEKTVMLSTHIMQEVEAICDRVIIIDKGKLKADKSIERIIHEEEERIILKVEFDKETSASQLKKIKGVLRCHCLEGNIWHLETSGKIDARQSVSKFSQENNLLILTMQIEEKSLEEIFKELTK